MRKRDYWTAVTKAGNPVTTDDMVILWAKLADAERDMVTCRTHGKKADRLVKVRVEIVEE